jgi:signal transduction histidine kinase
MDATEEGGTIEIRTALESGELRIDIRDDGHGIDPLHRDRIFQPYFTTKDTGTGLGLFVCRNIIEQNDGRIVLSETSTKGTTFTVRLEMKKMEAERTDATAKFIVDPDTITAATPLS